jgi:hypothetical protein
MTIQDKETLRLEVRAAMRKTNALDLWTHLPADPAAEETAYGIDALFALHPALLDEARALGIELPEERAARADALFQALFVDRTPLTDADLDALLTLERLGGFSEAQDLNQARERQALLSPGEHVEHVLELAKLRGVACVADPFAEGADRLWEAAGGEVSAKLIPALSVETLQRAMEQDTSLTTHDGEIARDPHGAHVGKIVSVLDRWSARLGARMVCAAWPGSGIDRDMLMRYAVLPFCERKRLPLVLTLEGGPAEVAARLAWLREALERFAELRCVLVARSAHAALELTAHAASLDGRVFSVLAGGPTTVALGAAGLRAAPFASGVAVLDHLVGRWVRARREIAQALFDRYLPLIKLGWPVDRERIEADTASLLGGNWEEFCNLQLPAQ